MPSFSAINIMEIRESIAWAFSEYMYPFVLSETYGNLIITFNIRQEMTKH